MLEAPVWADLRHYACDEFVRAGFKLPPVLVIDGVPVEGFQSELIDELPDSDHQS